MLLNQTLINAILWSNVVAFIILASLIQGPEGKGMDILALVMRFSFIVFAIGNILLAIM